MRMIAGILIPSSGRILYDGVPISTLKGSYRNIFGYLPQEFGFYPEFTVQDHLAYIAALKGLDTTESSQKIANELVDRYERELTVVNLRNESGSLVSMRYLADAPCVDNSKHKTLHLEDLYLWLFPQQNGKEGI